jgi:hypothetical protein
VKAAVVEAAASHSHSGTSRGFRSADGIIDALALRRAAAAAAAAAARVRLRVYS